MDKRNPSGVIENTTFIGLAGAIGAALAADVQSPEWRYVIAIGAPLVGKYAQMVIAALIGDTLADTIKRGSLALLAAFGLALGLSAQPSIAQDVAAPPAAAPAFGCGSGTCSLYVFDASWPPAIGVNALEFVRFRFGVGLDGVAELGQVSPIGGACLWPTLREKVGFLCPGS